MRLSRPLRIMSVVGARPNFMKIAPFVRAIGAYNTTTAGNRLEHKLVHTGQHYDDSMSRVFFDSLGIPDADINLGIGSGTHAEQVGRTMIAFEKTLQEHDADWVVLVGDVNATCACSIVAKKAGRLLAHIEAGLRSGDMSMPEEINRLVVDRLSDLLFTPDQLSRQNLLSEGLHEARVRFVGNIMIDTLEAQLPRVRSLRLDEIVRSARFSPTVLANMSHTIQSGCYALVTLHRPATVDSVETLGPIVEFLVGELASDLPVLWSIHPRTRRNLELFGIWDRVVSAPNVCVLNPLGYHEMLRLNLDARLLLTDSGGLQEESTVLGTPCLTLRRNTERPITLVDHGGTSMLVGIDVAAIRLGYARVGKMPRIPRRPSLWDGRVAERIVRDLAEYSELGSKTA